MVASTEPNKASGDGPARDVRSGLCSISFRNLEPEAVIELAADAGLEGIEWGADGHAPVRDVERAKRIAAACAERGIGCPSYGTYLGADPTKGTAEELCEIAVTLGASNLRIWTPFGTDHTADDATRAAIVDGLRKAAEVADDNGLTVSVEYHGWTLTHTSESALRLVEEVNAANFFLYWQPVYWEESVNHDADAQVASFEAVRPHLSHLHAYWWSGMDREPLINGADVWKRVLAQATEPGRWSDDRYAFLEYVPNDDPDALATEAATLHEWLDGAAEPG